MIEKIKELRSITSCGFGDCKKALEATNGDLEKAIIQLREKGLAVSAARKTKDAKEGTIALAVAEDKKSMALVEVNCETDFVAKTDAFQAFAKKAAEAALNGVNVQLICAEATNEKKNCYC